eukprot:jgi/Mesen1/7074/ME000369S06397
MAIITSSCRRHHLQRLLLSLAFGLLAVGPVRCDWFDKDYLFTWSSGEPERRDNGSIVALKLTRRSGSGWGSKEPWFHGWFKARIKLHKGYSAGVITAFYLTSEWDPEWSRRKMDLHDELDFEFLGNTSSEGVSVQTNWYAGGVGDHEERADLWFDPADDFHEYSIKWNWEHVVWYVDSIPIRELRRDNHAGVFPDRPMFMLGSLWEASKWATQGGRVPIDWDREPYFAEYADLRIESCYWRRLDSPAPPTCATNATKRPWDTPLAAEEAALLAYASKHYVTYDYRLDASRIQQGAAELTAPQQPAGAAAEEEAAEGRSGARKMLRL